MDVNDYPDCDIIEEEYFSLNICIPGQYVQRRTVFKQAPINSLNQLFPKERKIYIHNGEILNDQATFEDYGFQSIDFIVAISSKADNNYWIQVTQDSEAFAELMNTLTNPHARSETARIRDIHCLRSENRRSMFSRLSLLKKNDSKQNSNQRLSSYSDDIPKALQDSPLPSMW